MFPNLSSSSPSQRSHLHLTARNTLPNIHLLRFGPSALLLFLVLQTVDKWSMVGIYCFKFDVFVDKMFLYTILFKKIEVQNSTTNKEDLCHEPIYHLHLNVSYHQNPLHNVFSNTTEK